MPCKFTKLSLLRNRIITQLGGIGGGNIAEIIALFVNQTYWKIYLKAVSRIARAFKTIKMTFVVVSSFSSFP